MTKDDILQFLSDKFILDSDDLEELANDDSVLLFTEGILDSLSLIDLAKFVEDEAGIQTEPDEIELKNFDSIKKILKYVETKKAESMGV